MPGYFVSLLMGLGAGLAYGLVQVRSPAPPLIALVGLLGMVLGEKVVDAVRDHLVLAVLSSSADQRAHISEDKRFAVSKEGLEK